jgi:hypothetical protein
MFPAVATLRSTGCTRHVLAPVSSGADNDRVFRSHLSNIGRLARARNFLLRISVQCSVITCVIVETASLSDTSSDLKNWLMQ